MKTLILLLVCVGASALKNGVRQAIAAARDRKDTNRVINDDVDGDSHTHPSGECSKPKGVSVHEWDTAISNGHTCQDIIDALNFGALTEEDQETLINAAEIKYTHDSILHMQTEDLWQFYFATNPPELQENGNPSNNASTASALLEAKHLEFLHERQRQDAAALDLLGKVKSAKAIVGQTRQQQSGVSSSSAKSSDAVAVISEESVQAEKEFCWKDSYARGVGQIPGSCPAGKESGNNLLGLCYTKCSAFGSNFHRWGVDCHQTCKAGWDSHGVLCYKASSSYMRHGHVECGDPYSNPGCGGSHCSGGRSDCDGLCYPSCPSGWGTFGCPTCVMNCENEGYAAGTPPSCPKKIVISPGVQTGICQSSEDEDFGLCYPKCRAGYTGIGPVCWGDNPPSWESCGMGSAIDGTTCGTVIGSQVLGPLSIVAFIATLPAGGAGGAAVTQGTNAGLQATKKTVTFGAKAIAKGKQLFNAAGGGSLAKAVKKAYEKAKSSGLINAANMTNNARKYISGVVHSTEATTPADAIRAASEMAAAIDPSGIAATITAFSYPTCSEYFGPPETYGAFDVSSGSQYCVVEGSCVHDGGDGYSDEEDCTMKTSKAGVIATERFYTESGFDYLTIGGTKYSGTTSPNAIYVAKGTEIKWHSDGSISYGGDQSYHGFKFCLY